MATRIFDTPINTNDQSFERVLGAGLPVAALFWSGAQLDSALNDALNQAARDDSGKIIIAKVKTDDNPMVTQKYAVGATPTLVTWRDDKVFQRAVQPTPTEIRKQIDYLLGRATPPQTPPSPQPSATAATDGKPAKVTDASFVQDVMQSPVPVITDFWAAWCGPCRMIAPALEKIAQDYAGRVKIAKLNVDENPRTAQQFQVQSIPTLLLVKNGRVVDRLVGALPEGQLRAAADRLTRA